MTRSRGESGVVLVHVMMMALILMILASGVLQMVFSNHVLVSRVRNSDEKKFWVEACLSRRYAVWNGNPCNNSSEDNCPAGSLGTGSPLIKIKCECPSTCNPGPCPDCLSPTDRTVISYKVEWDGY